MPEFIQSEKGKPMLKIDDFLFVKDKQVDNKIYWKCNKFASSCKSRVITSDSKVVKVPCEHNHSGDSVNVQVRCFMNRVKQDAKETHDSPSLVICNATSQLSEATTRALPAITSMKRMIRNARQVRLFFFCISSI